MVVNKPAGLLSVPGKSDEPSAESLLHAKPVHRLDQDTSGLLVLAKTPEVYKTLQAYFQRRDILKRYEAVLSPNIKYPISNIKSEGQLDLPLLPNPYDRPRQMVDKEHGKVAITRYVIRERRDDGTILVDFYPLTGRTHQIRCHMSSMGHPLAGDDLYSGSREAICRQALHCQHIELIHPFTHERLAIDTPIPEDFQPLLR